MKSLFFCAAITVAADVVSKLEENYGAAETVLDMESWADRSLSKDVRASEEYLSVRTTDNCVFPLEVVIVQDATASFQDDFNAMVSVQLPLMTEALTASHPGSKFGVVSFRDKPIYPLGDASDYCQRFDTALTTDTSVIIEKYKSLTSVGGADPAENQFGALAAATQSTTPGWSSASSPATRLLVLSTDAYPHFEADGDNSFNLANFTGQFDEANAAKQCLEEYYPSPLQVRNSIYKREAYLAQLVFDGDWQNGLVRRSWEWFNNYIGQTSDFLEPLANDSSNFWEKLSLVIKAIEDAECKPETTTTTTTTVVTTTPATTTAPATTSTTTPAATTTTAAATPATTTTTAATTTTPTTTAATTTSAATTVESTTVASTTAATTPATTTNGCTEKPGCDEKPGCGEKPAVMIQLKDRPKKLRLEVDGEDKTLAA